jgi:hypothetical protein
MQFQVITVMYSRVLRPCKNRRFVVDHERASSLFRKYIMSIRRVRSVIHSTKETVYNRLFLRIINGEIALNIL